MAQASPIAGQQEQQSALARVVSAVLHMPAPWEIVPAAALAVILLIPYLNSASYFGLPFDDSYISLHFARNLARHGYLTFDGESASAGATSLLHVGLLAVPIKLGIDPINASVALGVSLHIALVGTTYWLAHAIFRDRLTSFVAAIFVGLTGYLAFDALNGMETTLFLVVSSATLATYFSARSERDYLITGVLAAFALLARPEAVLLIAAMALYELMRPEHRESLVSRPTLRRLALLLGPLLAVLFAMSLFYLATTGSFTPGTASAKMRFFREFELGWVARADATQNGLAGFAAPLIPFLVMAAFSIRRREALLFAFYWLAFTFMYYMLLPGGLIHYWYRYQHIFLPALLVFAAGGLVGLLRTVRWRSLDVVAVVVFGIPLIAGVLFQYNSFRKNYVRDVNVNEGLHVPMAKSLREDVPPGSTIATHDIGVIGYYSDREIIDLVGLVNPDAVDYHAGRRLREYIDRVQPDYIVLFPSWEFNFLHIGLNPFIFETVREYPSLGESYIFYRTHFPDVSPSDSRFPDELQEPSPTAVATRQ